MPPSGGPPRASALGVHPHLGLHVLYAEDEKPNRIIMGRFLDKLGCTSTLVEDGADVVPALMHAAMTTPLAFTAAAGGAPTQRGRLATPAAAGAPAAPRAYDVVLLDIIMRDVNGTAACAQIRAHPELAGLPVVAVTATGGDVDHLRRCGFNAVVHKPFTLASLGAVLEVVAARAVRRHRRGQPRQKAWAR